MKIHWKPLEQPAYSPDLWPLDYHMFGPLKEVLGGQRFDENAQAKQYLGNWLLDRPASFYGEGIKKLPIISVEGN